MIICIDPGANGAIACQDDQDRVWVDDMPNTIGDLWEYFDGLTVPFQGEIPEAKGYIENVGGYMPGNSGPAAVKFSRHVGNLEMALYAAGIMTTKISPMAWMKSLGVPKFTGTLQKKKTLRKNWIRDYVQRQFPTLKIKVSQADALGLMCYVLKGLK
jgi:hypothetical protein